MAIKKVNTDYWYDVHQMYREYRRLRKQVEGAFDAQEGIDRAVIEKIAEVEKRVAKIETELVK